MKKRLKELQEKMSKIKGYPIITTVKWRWRRPRYVAVRRKRKRAGKESEDVDVSGGSAALGFVRNVRQEEKAAESAKESEKDGNVLFEFSSEIKRIDVSSIPHPISRCPGVQVEKVVFNPPARRQGRNRSTGGIGDAPAPAAAPAPPAAGAAPPEKPLPPLRGMSTSRWTWKRGRSEGVVDRRPAGRCLRPLGDVPAGASW